MAKEDDKKEDKLVMVGDGSEVVEESVEAELRSDAKKENTEDTEAVEADGEEAGSDERVGHGEEEGEDREAIRARRRTERKNKRDREARNRRELEFLRTRNDALERQHSQLMLRQDRVEELSVDQRLSTLNSQISEAERIHAAAVTAKDGETATEALRVKDALLESKREVEGSKKARTSRKEEGTEQPVQRRVDPEVYRNARAWVDRNEWFDPNLGDETSHLVKVLEDRMSKEIDYTPHDPEYWEELDKRIAKRFPDVVAKRKKNGREEIFNDDDEDDEELSRKEPAKKKVGGPRFSVGGRTRSLKSNEVFISAERRKALEEAGVWDDPEARERYLNSYKRYDEEARNRN